jgi:hypothetical protein
MMKSGILLSTTASLMMLGSTAVFAQSYSAPNANPAQTSASSSQASFAQQPGVGIVSLKPGETFSTASQQDYGSVQAGATVTAPGSFVTLKPGQAG